MKILVQDRDQVVEYNKETPMLTSPIMMNGEIFGINLNYGDNLLGSFDSMGRAIEEMEKIMNFAGDRYVVGGFSNYDGRSDFEELMESMRPGDSCKE